MSTELSTETAGREVADHEPATGISASQRLALLKETLVNPDVAPDKARDMMELVFKLEDRQARANFIEAKAAAISSMPHIGKDGENTHTGIRYSTWERMQPQITPVLEAHGLALNFEIGHEDGRVSVTPILSGHGWVEKGGKVVLPADGSGSKNNVQAVGSSIKYGQRYAAMAMLNIISRGLVEDDDGHTGGGGTADPYELLTPEERNWVDEGRKVSSEGTAAYMAWFQDKGNKKRAGFLTYNKAGNGMSWHQQNKDAAHLVDNPPKHPE